MGIGQPRLAARVGRKFSTNIPATHAALAATLATCVMLGLAWWYGLRDDLGVGLISYAPSAEMIRAEQAAHANYRLFPNSNSRMFEADEAPLGKGNHIPSLEAPGWLNGMPDDADLDSSVLVIDVWDGVCPYCSLAAPALVEASEKYRDQGVVFVGLTTASEEEARQYVDNWHLPWPNGYDAMATVDALQAHAPTLFVVGPNGRILWNDDRARWRHEHADLGRRLENAIEDALSASRKRQEG